MKPTIKLVDQIYQSISGQSIYSTGVYNPEKIEIILKSFLINLIFIFSILILLQIVWNKKKYLLPITAILLTLLDQFLFSRGNAITIPISMVNQQSQASDWLSKNIDHYRYFSTSGNFSYTGLGNYWTNLKAREPFSPNNLTSTELKTFNRLNQELANLPENQGIASKIYDVSGYAGGISENVVRFWNENPPSPNAINITNLTDDKIDITGVKYIVTGYPQDYIHNLNDSSFKLVFATNGNKIYENTEVYPRAFLLNEEKNITPAKIVTYEPTNVIINTSSESETDLILTDTYYPGWEALVDGQVSEINLFENIFRKVRIPKGKHKVIFNYNPKPLKLGAIISFTTLVILIILIWQEKKSRSLSSTTTAKKTH